MLFVSKTEKASELALTPNDWRVKIIRYKMRFFATDGNVEHHKGTKN